MSSTKETNDCPSPGVKLSVGCGALPEKIRFFFLSPLPVGYCVGEMSSFFCASEMGKKMRSSFVSSSLCLILNVYEHFVAVARITFGCCWLTSVCVFTFDTNFFAQSFFFHTPISTRTVNRIPLLVSVKWTIGFGVRLSGLSLPKKKSEPKIRTAHKGRERGRNDFMSLRTVQPLPSATVRTKRQDDLTHNMRSVNIFAFVYRLLFAVCRNVCTFPLVLLRLSSVFMESLNAVHVISNRTPKRVSLPSVWTLRKRQS